MAAAKSSKADSLTKALGIGKQWALQKMNKMEPTAESGEFANMVKVFQSTRLELEELERRTAELLAAQQAAVQAASYFASALAKTGSHSKADAPAAATVQAYIPYSLQLQANQSKLTRAFEDLIVKTVRDLNAHEVRQNVALLKQLSVSRLDYDAKANKLAVLQAKADKSSPAAKEAVAELQLSTADKGGKTKDSELAKASVAAEEAAVSYAKIQEQITNLCHVIESRKNALLSHGLQDFIEAQGLYYHSCQEAKQEIGNLREHLQEASHAESPRSASSDQGESPHAADPAIEGQDFGNEQGEKPAEEEDPDV